MNKNVAITVISFTVVLALVLGITFTRNLSPAAMSNEQLSDNGLFVFDTPREIRDFSLIDTNNNAVNSDMFLGKWTLIFFGYTFCPDICPLTMATLNQFSGILESAGNYAEDTQVIMVSVDPQRDTLEKLSEYVGFFNNDYLGLTGEFIDIFNFASQLNIAFSYTPVADENYLVSHSGEVVLINPNGNYHGFFKVPHNPETMAQNYQVVRGRWN